VRNIAIITSETPNSLHAGSMQLLRVFRDYPADKLMVLGPQPPAGANTLACVYRTLAFPIMRWRNTRFHRQAMSLVLLHRWFRRSPRFVWKLLGDFEPDAVFTVMDNFSHYFTAYEYARRKRLPLITITMDEPDSFEKILPLLRARQRVKIAEVYRYAERNLCVSRQMTAHIASSYDCTTETFYFGPPEGVTPRPAAEAGHLRRDGRLVLGFAGSLSYGYGETLRRICAELLGCPVLVRIYSRNEPLWASPNMEYAGCLPSEELWATFKKECDASLLVYAFDYHENRLYRTHFPTKLSEYAWLGMPMVMVGPDYATGITWGLENSGCAMVYDKADFRSLPQWLEALASSPDLRCGMAESAAAAAKEEFDPTAIREKFTRLLQGADTTDL
jgi:glycosyltransferase involved in cell wall biosynthesis